MGERAEEGRVDGERLDNRRENAREEDTVGHGWGVTSFLLHVGGDNMLFIH